MHYFSVVERKFWSAHQVLAYISSCTEIDSREKKWGTVVLVKSVNIKIFNPSSI